jgi:hypothetical protein
MMQPENQPFIRNAQRKRSGGLTYSSFDEVKSLILLAYPRRPLDIDSFFEQILIQEFNIGQKLLAVLAGNPKYKEPELADLIWGKLSIERVKEVITAKYPIRPIKIHNFFDMTLMKEFGIGKKHVALAAGDIKMSDKDLAEIIWGKLSFEEFRKAILQAYPKIPFHSQALLKQTMNDLEIGALSIEQMVGWSVPIEKLIQMIWY